MIHHIEFNGFHGHIEAVIRAPAPDRDGDIAISPRQAARLDGLACPGSGSCACGEHWAWQEYEGGPHYAHTGVTRGSYTSEEEGRY